MPIRKSLVTALVALSLASGGKAVLADDPGWIEVVSYSFGSSQASAGDRSITVHGHRTETVGAAPADRDVQLKGQKILQNTPAQEAYLQLQLKRAMVSSYSMSGTIPAAAGVLKLEPVEPKAAIAINTPLRTLPNRSAADAPASGLMKLETLPRQGPTLGVPVGRR